MGNLQRRITRVPPGGSLPLSPRRTASLGTSPKWDWDMAEQVITNDPIKWAVNVFSPYEAVGPDGILPALLQRGLDLVLSLRQV